MGRQEEKIREERTYEAMSKNLMGKGGKLSAIALLMGSPIISEGLRPFEDNDYDGMPYYDGYSSFMGWLWDSLREGVNLEIRVDGYAIDDNALENFVLHEIKVSYHGYPVYYERQGRLELYTPTHPIVGKWESLIDKFYERAITLRKRQVRKEEAKKKEQAKGMAAKLLEMLRLKWGD